MWEEPDGGRFTNRDSLVPVTFPYTPRTEYRPAPAEAVDKGRIDVVRAVPPTSGRGRYTVTVLAAELTPADAVAYLNGMQ